MKTKLLIFGITGYLSSHRLLPAIERIISTGKFDDLSVIGVSRHAVDKMELLSVGEYKFLPDKLSIFSMDLDEANIYSGLREYISLGADEQLLIYLAIPPKVVAQVINSIGRAGLNTSNVKILFEKPFGVDLASAEDIIKQTASYYKEDQIYRIDHYLAKEMAQNIVAFRGKNALFNNIWNNNFIDSIKIIASEEIGIAGRANFYEQTGALRDLVQGHLMQLLALTLMDVPHNFEWDSLSELRLEALNQLQSIDPKKAFRAQYLEYKNEVNNENSLVETFVSLDLVSDQPHWVGVPIQLTTGKSLAKKFTEIRVRFKRAYNTQSNCLVFRIQPDEGIELELYVKKPGYDNEFEIHHLSFSYPDDTILPDAYEQVIVDAISSRKSLFTSGEEVLQSWRVLQPIQDYWNTTSDPLKTYPTGASIDEVLA